jgi:hypothetical protein
VLRGAWFQLPHNPLVAGSNPAGPSILVEKIYSPVQITRPVQQQMNPARSQTPVAKQIAKSLPLVRFTIHARELAEEKGFNDLDNSQVSNGSARRTR